MILPIKRLSKWIKNPHHQNMLFTEEKPYMLSNKIINNEIMKLGKDIKQCLTKEMLSLH